MNLTKCRKCGADHGMGVVDIVTKIHTPIDLCLDCLWKDGYTHQPLIEQLVIDENAICECWICLLERTSIIASGAAEQLLKHQDEIIRDMMNSSSSPPHTSPVKS